MSSNQDLSALKKTPTLSSALRLRQVAGTESTREAIEALFAVSPELPYVIRDDTDLYLLMPIASGGSGMLGLIKLGSLKSFGDSPQTESYLDSVEKILSRTKKATDASSFKQLCRSMFLEACNVFGAPTIAGLHDPETADSIAAIMEENKVQVLCELVTNCSAEDRLAGETNAGSRELRAMDEFDEQAFPGLLWASDAPRFPNEREIGKFLESAVGFLLPGFRDIRLNADTFHAEIKRLLLPAITRSFVIDGDEHSVAHGRAIDACELLMDHHVVLREKLAKDAQQNFEKDPAMKKPWHVPKLSRGFDALVMYRVANLIHQTGSFVSLLMSKYVSLKHSIEIHPGAVIGSGMFIDHGGLSTVIGETAEFGENCSCYQSGTFGALQFEFDEETGMLRKDYKRHPTIEDDVVIYSGASVFGGETVIGKGSVIAALTRVDRSVPPYHLVWTEQGDLRMRPLKNRPAA